MARHRPRRSRKRYFPHIYFESKEPGRDSVLAAVYDRGRPGVNSAFEVKLLAFAQLADYADKKTVNHYGKVIPFSEKLWRGRTLVLRRLAQRYGGMEDVKIIEKAKVKLDKAKSMKQKEEILMEVAKRIGISKEIARSIIEKVKQRK